MKAYQIETDVLIDLFNQREEAHALIEKLARSERIVISAVSVAELRAGWDEKKAAYYLPTLYDIAEVMPLTKEIAELAGKLRFTHKRQGKPLPTIDTLIGATAIFNDFCLVTRNIKDYQVPAIQLYQEIYK